MKSSAGDVDVELLKAVAQAWYAHSGNPRSSSRAASLAEEDGAGVCVRRAGAQRYRPTRFKLEAAAQRSRSWDFAQSLWDTYELVSVAQRIESSLAIIDEAAAAPPPPRAVADEGAARGAGGGGGKRPRDGRRSLKSLFHRSSPRRFEESSR
uniref:Uncharacterized protein n=1 Tax=Avena sativa TaxID=4498 RepID=A0ACD5ZIZ9_AVESA